MGGQVADHGVISADGVTFQVTDVQKNKGGKYMHTGKLTQGVLKVGGTVSASIDVKRRKAVMRAHSATHLLDAVLHQVLGDHVHQAGSLVEPDKLRFDFTHFAALTAEELSQVSALVNEAVLYLAFRSPHSIRFSSLCHFPTAGSTARVWMMLYFKSGIDFSSFLSYTNYLQ